MKCDDCGCDQMGRAVDRSGRLERCCTDDKSMNGEEKQTIVDLTHSKTENFDDMKDVEELEELYIRQCMFTSLDGLENCVWLGTLKRLDLYLNTLTGMQGIRHLTALEYLDLSFNEIRNVEGLENLQTLQELYLANNKIKVIENLDHLQNLTLLELGSNRIRVCDLVGMDSGSSGN